MSFVARLLRFASIEDPFFLNEKIYGPIALRHVLLGLPAIAFAYFSMKSPKPINIFFAVILGGLSLFSIFFPRRSYRGEVFIAAILSYVLERTLSIGSKTSEKRGG